MLTDKRIKAMSVRALRAAQTQRDAVIQTTHRELKLLQRELERRTPCEVHFRIEMDDRSFPGICFEAVDAPTRRHPDGQRHRVHPRKPGGATRYPQDLCADEIEAWMVREGITHVISESEDTKTSPESLAGGRYTRAQFVKWWRLLEEED
jgi:hypothetical protein